VTEELVEAVRERRAVLFVGAGVSAGLGLPSWRQLIDLIADDLGYDSEIFNRLGDFQTLAEYYVLERGGIGPLRSKLDIAWHPPTADLGNSRVHQALVELEAPLIYTTNWDRWLERSFERAGQPFQKVVSVRDLRRETAGVTQIVKFHGDFDDDESIVLTDSSYLERLAFDSPLDIKLRADTLGRTVLFVGYSLADINMRYLLYKLTKIWEESAYATARPRSYIVLPRTNPVQEAVLESRGVRAIAHNADDQTEGLRLFLEGLLKDALGKTLADGWPAAGAAP
jgi:hypothetical protein